MLFILEYTNKSSSNSKMAFIIAAGDNFSQTLNTNKSTFQHVDTWHVSVAAEFRYEKFCRYILILCQSIESFLFQYSSWKILFSIWFSCSCVSLLGFESLFISNGISTNAEEYNIIWEWVETFWKINLAIYLWHCTSQGCLFVWMFFFWQTLEIETILRWRLPSLNFQWYAPEKNGNAM